MIGERSVGRKVSGISGSLKRRSANEGRRDFELMMCVRLWF